MQSRYFDKFKTERSSAELFDPVLVPYYNDSNYLFKAIKRDGQDWISVRLAFISMDEHLLTFKSERFGVCQPTYKYVYLPQDRFIDTSLFRLGRSPFAKPTVCRFELSDRPYREGQKPEQHPFFADDPTKMCYTNMEIITCETQAKYDKVRLIGLNIIKNNYKEYLKSKAKA